MLLTNWSIVVLLVAGATNATVRNTSITLHNNHRRAEAKQLHASNIYQLVWDPNLAQQAQTWANACKFQHQDTGKGENLYYSSPRTGTDDSYVQKALDEWMKEKSLNSDHTFNCCFSGNFKCCHYTQVISARSKTIGCAVGHCASLTTSGGSVANAAFVTCFYQPMGNVAVNGRHIPFASGAPCSACDQGDTCNDGLCVNSA